MTCAADGRGGPPAGPAACAPGGRPGGFWPASTTTRPPTARPRVLPAWPGYGSLRNTTGPPRQLEGSHDRHAHPRADRVLGSAGYFYPGRLPAVRRLPAAVK